MVHSKFARINKLIARIVGSELTFVDVYITHLKSLLRDRKYIKPLSSSYSFEYFKVVPYTTY